MFTFVFNFRKQLNSQSGLIIDKFTLSSALTMFDSLAIIQAWGHLYDKRDISLQESVSSEMLYSKSYLRCPKK